MTFRSLPTVYRALIGFLTTALFDPAKSAKNLSDDVFAYCVRPNAGFGRLSRICKQTGPSAGRF